MNIISYEVGLIGSGHEAENLPCQDNHRIHITENAVFVAVADGVGSEEHSDLASKIAVDSTVEYCCENIDFELTEDEILSIIRDSFSNAQNRIKTEAESRDYPLDQCDTTLTLAVYHDGMLFFGQAGDSGILALGTSGRYGRITECQRDTLGQVFPLRSGIGHWVFGIADNVSNFLLATDGLFDLFFPAFLSFEDNPVNMDLSSYFLDNTRLMIDQKSPDELQKIKQSRIDYVKSLSGTASDDDLTLIVVLDLDRPPGRQPDGYYNVDYEKIRSEYKEKIYYNLYGKHFDDDAPDVEEESTGMTNGTDPEDSCKIINEVCNMAAIDETAVTETKDKETT